MGLEAVGEAEPAVEEPNGAVVAPHRDAAAAARAAGDATRDLGRHGGGRPSAPAAAAGRLLLEELELAPLVHAGPARGGRIGRRRGGSGGIGLRGGQGRAGAEGRGRPRGRTRTRHRPP